jgi:hypothetical protein
MGWSRGFDSTWNRDIGYGVPAYCDAPGCMKEIDRGLSYVCANQEPYGGDKGCGLYFCGDHLRGMRCARCWASKPPYKRISPEHPEWLRFKAEQEMLEPITKAMRAILDRHEQSST